MRPGAAMDQRISSDLGIVYMIAKPNGRLFHHDQLDQNRSMRNFCKISN